MKQKSSIATLLMSIFMMFTFLVTMNSCTIDTDRLALVKETKRADSLTTVVTVLRTQLLANISNYNNNANNENRSVTTSTGNNNTNNGDYNVGGNVDHNEGSSHVVASLATGAVAGYLAGRYINGDNHSTPTNSATVNSPATVNNYKSNSNTSETEMEKPKPSITNSQPIINSNTTMHPDSKLATSLSKTYSVPANTNTNVNHAPAATTTTTTTSANHSMTNSLNKSYSSPASTSHSTPSSSSHSSSSSSFHRSFSRHR